MSETSKGELFGRTIRISAVAALLCALLVAGLAFGGASLRPLMVVPAVLGLLAVQALAYVLWRRWQPEVIWRASEQERDGFGYPYTVIPLSLGFGLTLFPLLLFLLLRMGLSMKLAWLSIGITGLLCFGFLLPMTVRLTRHILPILWARLIGAPREGSPYAWQGTVASGSLTRVRSYTATRRQRTETRTNAQGHRSQVQVNVTVWDWRERITATRELLLEVGEEKLAVKLDQAVGLSAVRSHDPTTTQEWIKPGMNLVVQQARYLDPIGRGIQGQFKRPLRLFAAPAGRSATRSAAFAWLAQLGVTAAFLGVVLLGGLLAWTNPALGWHRLTLHVMQAEQAPAAVGELCDLRLGLLAGTSIGSVDREPLPAVGWPGEGGEGQVARADESASPDAADAERLAALVKALGRRRGSTDAPSGGTIASANGRVEAGRCYLRLWCGGVPLVSGFDAGGFDCELEVDADTGELTGAFGGDDDDEDGDPAWKTHGQRFELRDHHLRLEGWFEPAS